MATTAPTLPTPQETRRVTLALPSNATKSILLLVLLADTPVPSVKQSNGTYHAIFSTLFARASAALSSSASPSTANAENEQENLLNSHELTVESYDVVNGQGGGVGAYPSEERVREADGVLVTGSASSAYLPTPWITILTSFVASLPSLNPRCKIIGICFGHQIIARAFNGEDSSSVEVNDKGWEIGVRSIQLTEEGRGLFGGERLTVHQMHRDHVPLPRLPEGFHNLGSTDKCAVHGMCKLVDPQGGVEWGNVGVVTLQGHPEFTEDIVRKIIAVREAGGVISHEVAEESRGFAKEEDEGVRIGGLLLGMLMQVN